MEPTFTFQLVEDSNLEEIKRKNILGSTTMETIQKTMLTEFNIAADVETRLWLLSNASSFSPILVSCLGEKVRSVLGRYSFRKVIIEVKNEDGTWPRNVGYHRRSPSSYVTAPTSSSQSVNEKMINPRKDIIEIQDKLKIKRKENVDVDKSLVSINQKQEELEKEKKKLEEEKKKLEEEQKKLELEKNALSDRRKKTTDEIKSLEDSLNQYVEATRDLVSKLDLGSEIANSNLIAFLTKSIDEKEKALACPVCLETAEAPIFMCLQQHLVCSSCQPRVTSCPECREAYQVNTLFSLVNTDHVT